MIPKKYTGDQLKGKYCRPVRKIKNGAGAAITPDTICRIVNVVRGYGFTIETVKCNHCGQSAYISRVAREDLELIDNPMMDDLVHDGSKSAEKLQELCDKIDQITGNNALERNMKIRFLKNGELDDGKIIATLIQAAKDYENGEIAEVRDTLVDIVNSIDEFENMTS